jgi:hypothetical protein
MKRTMSRKMVMSGPKLWLWVVRGILVPVQEVVLRFSVSPKWETERQTIKWAALVVQPRLAIKRVCQNTCMNGVCGRSVVRGPWHKITSMEKIKV